MAGVPNPSSTWKLIDRWTIPICIGVGVFLFWAAARYTVFDDEALSCRLYTLPMGEMVRALWNGADPDPPLYYLFENVFVHLLGVGPLGLRSFSIVCFLAGLIVIRAAAEAWFDRRTGLVTLLLCALHPAHLFFGFAARWYSMMFLVVALLLWASAGLVDDTKKSRLAILAWTCTAAGVCYTNYFGPVIVTLVWLATVWKGWSTSESFHRTLFAAIGSAVLYAPWFGPLWQEVGRFPTADGVWLSHVATAARTVAALLTGNLANAGAWWVWIPMAAFVVAFGVLMRMHWRRIGPPALIVFGCLFAGVASGTLIDKYILIFSGPACLLVASTLTGRLSDIPSVSGEADRPTSGRSDRIWRPVLVLGLIAGWAGCFVNLVSESHWSSLRWLDPFETAVAELLEDGGAASDVTCVMTHPSARYYYARLLPAYLQSGEASDSVSDLETWRRFAIPPAEGSGVAAETPESVVKRMGSGRLPVIVTMETTGFVDRFDWDMLYDILSEEYTLVGEPRYYLEDPDSAWKDRFDPKVEHPAWRIVVRRWRLRE